MNATHFRDLPASTTIALVLTCCNIMTPKRGNVADYWAPVVSLAWTALALRMQSALITTTKSKIKWAIVPASKGLKKQLTELANQFKLNPRNLISFDSCINY